MRNDKENVSQVSEIDIEFKDQKPMDRTSAIFYGNKQIDDAEHIYLPSYDITQNIKTKQFQFWCWHNPSFGAAGGDASKR